MRWDHDTHMPRTPQCPQCGADLQIVCQTYPAMLNDDQFASIKTGDYYCEHCPPNTRSKTNRYCYWWKREVWPQEEVYHL